MGLKESKEKDTVSYPDLKIIRKNVWLFKSCIQERALKHVTNVFFLQKRKVLEHQRFTWLTDSISFIRWFDSLWYYVNCMFPWQQLIGRQQCNDNASGSLCFRTKMLWYPLRLYSCICIPLQHTVWCSVIWYACI